VAIVVVVSVRLLLAEVVTGVPVPHGGRPCQPLVAALARPEARTGCLSSSGVMRSDVTVADEQLKRVDFAV